MDLVLPTWFKYRQGKAEPAGENAVKLTAPNLPDATIGIRTAENGNWQGVLRTSTEGLEMATTQPEFVTSNEAWGAAFELYRNYVVVGPT